MDNERLIECLAADFTLLRAAAVDHLNDPVPSCPQWSGEDLVRHVAAVYLHKAECMRTGRAPQDWPPAQVNTDPALAVLDRGYRELTAEFAARNPRSPAPTWYGPDQTVGFWVRRMAQETLIHRVDAELTAAAPVTPIARDLALDGIDELLVCFLAYQSQDDPPTTPGGDAPGVVGSVLITAGSRDWLVHLDHVGVRVEPATPGQAATAGITGEPTDLLWWLWRRDAGPAPTVGGDLELVGRLREVLGEVTQ